MFKHVPLDVSTLNGKHFINNIATSKPVWSPEINCLLEGIRLEISLACQIRRQKTLICIVLLFLIFISLLFKSFLRGMLMVVEGIVAVIVKKHKKTRI